MKAFRALLLAAVLAAGLTAGADRPLPARGRVVVHVTGFSDDRGHARIGLFNRGEGFPMDSTKALTGAHVAIVNREATTVFDSLPYGTYAVIAHHDENDNYKVDRNWFGKPTEQYGASNNPAPRLGPPRWKDAAFDVKSDSAVITIHLHS